jgi:ADP-dependent phosphofructokinase/glucokinase
MGFHFKGENFIVPRDNRLIVSSRPKWIRIEMVPELYERIPSLQANVDGALLAGYQMIKEEYEDGSTYIGYEELAYSVINKGENAIVSLFEGAVKLLKELELERVHIHSLGFYICVVAKDCPVSVLDHRKALLFASTTAAAQALQGEIVSLESTALGLDVPVSEKGYGDLERLKDHLVSSGMCCMKDFENGCIRTPQYDAIVVPAKVVSEPVATVGIGDVISAAAFAGFLSKLK